MRKSGFEAVYERALTVLRRRTLVDAKLAPAVPGEVFSYISGHFAAADFALEDMARKGLNNRVVREVFREAMGKTIAKYVSDLKGELAAELLSGTGVKVKVIAKRLHYTQTTNFARDFRKWSGGQSPRSFRMAALRREVAPGSRYLAREGIFEHIRDRARGARQGPIFIDYGQMPGDSMALNTWAEILGETPAMQHRLLRHYFLFADRSFFNFMSGKARNEGCHDRARGVYLAGLALASAEGTAELLGERAGEIVALGCARLGDAQRLAGDLRAADQAFDRVREELEAPEAEPDQRAMAEILLLEGVLRFAQRRLDVSLDLLDRAAGLAREISHYELMADIGLNTVSVLVFQGRRRQVIAKLNSIEETLEARRKPDHKRFMLVCQELSIAYLETGETARAAEILRRAREIEDRLDDQVEMLHLDRIEGKLAKMEGRPGHAEVCLRRSRAGFAQISDHYNKTATGIEIATLCCEQGRYGEVFELILADVVPFFEAQEPGPETGPVLDIVNDGIATRSITLDILRRVREFLCRRRLERRNLLPRRYQRSKRLFPYGQPPAGLKEQFPSELVQRVVTRA